MSIKKYAPNSDRSIQNRDDIDVIVTSCGGTDMPRAAYRGGVLVGMSSAKNRPPAEVPVNFIDWPFLEDDFEFEDHLNVVKREEPTYAVAPDIHTDETLDSAIAKADRLNRHAEIVIVVPKGVKPDKVPSRFRVGLPAQDRFGGVPWPVWEYRNCSSVHILGGSPNRQEELAHYVNVDSVDTASPLKAAQFGDVWENGEWSEQGSNYYERVERSMIGLLNQWEEKVDKDKLHRRRRAMEMPETPNLMPDELKAEPPSREELCIGPNEDRPFPGREYFYRDDTLSYQEYQEQYL